METPERPDHSSMNPAPSRREAAEPELIATYRREPATAAESQEDDAPEGQSGWMLGTAAQNPSPALTPEDSPVAPVAHREQVVATPALARASDAGGQCPGGRFGQRWGHRQRGDAAAVDTSAQGTASPG